MKKIIITIVLITSCSCIAQADIVVDTGTPTDCFGMVVYGWSETEYQWLAARFTLTNDYNITKIEGYFSD